MNNNTIFKMALFGKELQQPHIKTNHLKSPYIMLVGLSSSTRSRNLMYCP